MTLEPGTTLGTYEVLGPLGAGGMGEVYRARDRKLGRDVAIKVLPEAFAQDATRLARFDREARMLASVNHPALAAIYGFEEWNGLRYIVMELVPGETLAQATARGPLPMHEALGTARQIAEALEAAHEAGIVHRDLKPANVKVTPEGRVKVLDLGLAKAMDVKAESADSSDSPTLQLDETQPGMLVGTIEFMSPEQARGRRVDKRTDVWAFGCVLFEILSGRRAFSGETPTDVLASIVTREPDWSALPADTPPRVRELLERCLQKDVNRRLRDIGDARIALEDAVAESAERRVPGARKHERRERRLVIATLAVLFAAALTWLAIRPRAGVSASGGRSLAVLPFRDLSGRPDGQLMGDGLVETVSSRLASVPGVQVVTPAASVAAADRESDIFRIGRDLGANLVLRGAIQRQGDRLRITYSVWNTKTRSQAAGGDLTGAASDLFSIQDRLADQVARDLDLPAPTRRTPPPAGLSGTREQERYLQALGLLLRYDKAQSVDAAIAELEQLTAAAPGAPLAQAALARAYLHRHTLTHDKQWAEKALAAADRAARLDAGLPEVHATRGLILTRTGKGGEAISEFQVALSQTPDALDAVLGLAEAYQSIGRTNDAETAYRKAIALQPESWAVYNQVGSFYYRLGRYPQAVEMFRRVVDITPDNVRGWNNLGAAYQQMDRFDEAMKAYAESARVKPNDGAFSNLGTLQFFLGRYADAAASFAQAAALSPEKALYWANLGDAYRWAPGMRPKSAEAYSRAIAAAQEQLSTNSNDADALLTLGLALAKSGKPTEGLAQVKRAVDLEPGNPDTFYAAAVVSNLLGRGDDAVGWLRRAVDAGMGVRQIEKEPEFENLRKTPAFLKVFPQQEKAA